MAEAPTPAASTADTPKKRRKPQGPRQLKPMFAVVTYQDENGNEVALNKGGIRIRLERDAAKLLEMVTSEGVGSAAVVRVELPAAAPKPAAS
jgi:hypothetical protein